jgi:thioredoxin-like negative regulator of GroEL
MLFNVGRVADAVERLRQANDMLALYMYTPLTLADALVAAGKAKEARSLFDAAIELAPDSNFAGGIALTKATDTADVEALLDPKLPLSPDMRAALSKGYRAVTSGDAGGKAEAVRMLRALPQDQQNDAIAGLLAQLGLVHEAFQIATRRAAREYPGPSLFWYPSMRATLSDPGFPAVAERFGLMKYWRATHARPDVCNEKKPPPFCRMI